MVERITQTIFTSDPEFIAGVQGFELCADRNSKGSYLDFAACEGCQLHRECVTRFDRIIDKLDDKQLTPIDRQCLIDNSKNIHKQPNLFEGGLN